MLDDANVDQQEALGVIGVNLLYGAFYYHEPETLIPSLQENLAPGRIEVDMIKFSGPDFQRVDNRLMSLQLVSQGLTNAVMFRADGETVQPAEVFFQKGDLGRTREFSTCDLRHERHAGRCAPRLSRTVRLFGRRSRRPHGNDA